MKDEKDPEWLPTAGALFQENVDLTTSFAGNNASFNLRFRAFGCADEGTYECEVFTYTQTLKSQTELIAKGKFLKLRPIDFNIASNFLTLRPNFFTLCPNF